MTRRPVLWSVIAVAITIAAIAGALVAWTDWSPWLSWLAATNLTALSVQVLDKTQAKRRGFRIPEIVLHALALAGGVGGAWIGILLLRHKSRKPLFWIVLVVSTLVHLSVGYQVFH